MRPPIGPPLQRRCRPAGTPRLAGGRSAGRPCGSRRGPSSCVRTRRMVRWSRATSSAARGRRPAGPGRARPATGSRRPGGCRCRRCGADRAARPSAAPARRRAPPPAGARVIEQGVRPRARASSGQSSTPPSRRASSTTSEPPPREGQPEAPPGRVQRGRARTRAPRSGRRRRPAADRSCRSAARATGPSVSSMQQLAAAPCRRDRPAGQCRREPRPASSPRFRNQASGATTVAMVRPTTTSAACR